MYAMGSSYDYCICLSGLQAPAYTGSHSFNTRTIQNLGGVETQRSNVAKLNAMLWEMPPINFFLKIYSIVCQNINFNVNNQKCNKLDANREPNINQRSVTEL